MDAREGMINGYSLSRQYFDFTEENRELISAAHAGLYFYLIDLNNRLSWKNTFGLPTVKTMDMLGISSYKTYKKLLFDLERWGFIRFAQRAKNQHTANVVALVNNAKAVPKHIPKQGDIDKQYKLSKLIQTLKAADENFFKAFQIWLDYKNDSGFPYKLETTLQKAYDRLRTLSGNNSEVAAEIVNKSIANNVSYLMYPDKSKAETGKKVNFDSSQTF